MTDLIAAQIPPAAVTTVERAAIYHLSLLYDLFGGTPYQEVAGEALTPLITAQQGRAGDGTERLIYRVSLQLHPEWRTSTNAIWVDSIAFGNPAIPARYKV